MVDIKLLGTNSGQFYGDLNDISYDSRGNLVMVSGLEYTRQALTKTLLTSNLNLPFTSYGAALQDMIHTSAPPEQAQSLIVSTILFALTYYNATVVNATPNQLINTVVSIEVTQLDAQAFEVLVTVLLQSGDVLTIPLGS